VECATIHSRLGREDDGMCKKNNTSAAESGRQAVTLTLKMEQGGGRQTGDRMLKIMLKAPRRSAIFDWVGVLASSSS
jgi:hypothetical protein